MSGDYTYQKQMLTFLKRKRELEDKSPKDREIGMKVLKQDEKIAKQEAAIRAQKEKVKEGSFYERSARKIEKVASKAMALIPKRLTNKRVLKPQQRVGVDLRQPVYTKDKSRYFKTAWEEEKRQLFFK